MRHRLLASFINEATGAPFAYRDACVSLGPTVGADPAAREAATADVTAFVRPVIAR